MWVREHRWLVGSNIKAVRSDKGRTQEELAEAVGVDVKTISRAENGRHAITIDLVAAISRALGVPSSVFFEERDWR